MYKCLKEGRTSPICFNLAKQPMLNQIPLGSAGGQLCHGCEMGRTENDAQHLQR